MAEESAPTDPPGLAEAIEAMRASLPSVGIDPTSQWAQTLPLEHLARAAAPILVKAALLEAADEIASERAAVLSTYPSRLTVATWLRGRAHRIGGGV
jgi:hypothetical protein